MGTYIEVPETKGKVTQILKIHGGQEVSGFVPATFSDIPVGQALICVVANGPFEAAAWLYDAPEFAEFTRLDGRPKRWLLIPWETAIKATNFAPRKPEA